MEDILVDIVSVSAISSFHDCTKQAQVKISPESYTRIKAKWTVDAAASNLICNTSDIAKGVICYEVELNPGDIEPKTGSKCVFHCSSSKLCNGNVTYSIMCTPCKEDVQRVEVIQRCATNDHNYNIYPEGKLLWCSKCGGVIKL